MGAMVTKEEWYLNILKAVRGKLPEELTVEVSMDFQAEGTVLTIFTNGQRQKKACCVLGRANSFELIKRRICVEV